MINRQAALIITAVGFHCLCRFVPAQEFNATQQKYLEDMAESMAENAEESIDLSSLLENLSSYLDHPLHINSATLEELSDLQILTDFQMAMIIEYRQNNGSILTLNELLYLPGFRQQDVEMLEAFVICYKPGERIQFSKELKSKSGHQFLCRYQRILEKQKGYVALSDSALAENPDQSRYLGTADKIYVRYKASFGTSFTTAFLMEKDAGEEFFKGSNRQGFDFYSAHIAYNSKQGVLQNMTVGDYHVRWGQGLLVWSGSSFGKTSYTSNIIRRPSGIKGNASVDESRFFRGAAMTLGMKKFRLTTFFSYRDIDATLSDSTGVEARFTGFVTTGYHATPSDLEKEKSVKQTMAGSSLQYNGNRLKAGVNVCYTLFGKTLLKSNDLYKMYSFSGKEFTGISVDYKYLAGKTQVFGETSYSNSYIASLNGIFLILRPEIHLGIIHRYYQPGYFSYYANAFAENSAVSNENGFFLGGEFQYADFRLKLYGDIFSFPWLKYRVNAPSEGYEYAMEVDKRIKKAELYFRYKRQEKPENYFDDEKLFELRILSKEQFRLNGVYYAGEKWRFQNRVEISKVFFHHEKKEYGFLGLQDIVYSHKSIPLELSVRLAYFNAPEYKARIYAYERDVLYAFSSQLYYGKGWRFVAMLKWEPAQYLTCWFRISQSLYPGQNEIGTGLNAINSNHKTEIKIQAIAKF